ncbi:MAG: hypothetical protein RIR00_1008 [Pseudomonadota bacterium]|jgi:hypothetical protein
MFKRWTAENDARLIAMSNNDAIDEDIAAAIGCSTGAVKNRRFVLRKAGLLPKKSTNAEVQVVAGIRVGTPEHKILLAMRPAPGIELTALRERYPTADVSRFSTQLVQRGLAFARGSKTSLTYFLTAAGQALVSPSGPLSARNTLITYCEL